MDLDKDRQTLTGDIHSVVLFENVNPAFIRPGHLVELQIGVCAIRTGRDKLAFITKLRAICILSRRVEHVSGTPGRAHKRCTHAH